MTLPSAIAGVQPRIRGDGMGFYFPGEPVAIKSLPLTPEEIKRLPRLGQEITYRSLEEDSTELMVRAARQAIERSGISGSNIRLVISAPSLISSYGLEIPSVAVRAALGLKNAECINLEQGCVGVLRAIDLAAQMLAAKPDEGDILVVTSCRASRYTTNMTHGSFFWGDGAAAVIVTPSPCNGIAIVDYKEICNEVDWGAMRIPFGDASRSGVPDLIQVGFANAESQIDYVRGEQFNFASIVDRLLGANGLAPSDIEAVFLPSTGKNRAPILFNDHPELFSRLNTEFKFAHFGGVDPIFSLHQYLERLAPPSGAWLLAASPAFTAQWGGLLMRVVR